MNRIRVFTSGALFLFAIICLLFHPTLPFSLPQWVYIVSFIYFAFFPIKDMFSKCNATLYKGRQFAKHFTANPDLNQDDFKRMKSIYDKRACFAMLFWLLFLLVPGLLYISGILDKIWIFFFFTLSNFSVFYAIFGWCPFHSIFIRPDCCMECRIYNWDSFFQYSFLIFIPNLMTITLFLLGLCSLLKWEYMHYKYPQHFYKASNLNLTCEHCDLDTCRKHKKRRFHKTLKEEYLYEKNLSQE